MQKNSSLDVMRSRAPFFFRMFLKDVQSRMKLCQSSSLESIVIRMMVRVVLQLCNLVSLDDSTTRKYNNDVH